MRTSVDGQVLLCEFLPVVGGRVVPWGALWGSPSRRWVPPGCRWTDCRTSSSPRSAQRGQRSPQDTSGKPSGLLLSVGFKAVHFHKTTLTMWGGGASRETIVILKGQYLLSSSFITVCMFYILTYKSSRITHRSRNTFVSYDQHWRGS